MERIAKYAGQWVGLQLKTPLFMLSYTETKTVNGMDVHGLAPAVYTSRVENKETGQFSEVPQVVGFSEVIPLAQLECIDGEVRIKMKDPSSGATLVIGVPPDEIRYITTVEPPSRLFRK